MIVETFTPIRDGIADTPPTEAANLQLRSRLQIALQEQITSWNLPQGEAAARLGICRPRLNNLLRGKIQKFSLDALINLATISGFVVEVSLKKIKLY